MDQHPDLTKYSVDELGAVHLSDELSAWTDAGSSWRRHWLYHQACREHYIKTHGGPPKESAEGRKLSTIGHHLLPGLLPADECGQFTHSMSQFVENKYGKLDGFDETALTAVWSHQRAAMFRRALPTIFNPDVTAMIEDYFGSCFQIFSVTMNRYLPSPEKDVSFLWHRDCEPPQQLHFMIYLTGASDEGGRTAAVDLSVTRKAAEAGYSFPPVDRRVSDIAEVEGLEEGTEFLNPELEPGGGFIFAAPRTLHRGQLPVKGWRDTILMLLWPSPVPWQQRLNNNFPTILRGGPHYTSGALNPFGAMTLSSKDRHGIPPHWAQLGDLFPPEGELPA